MRALAALAAAALLVSAFVAAQPTAAQAAGSSCGANINLIACENSKPGADPSTWQIEGAGDDSIQGFATDISVNAGQRIDFKIDTDASAYSIDIYRTGWYQGLGARHIASVTPSARLPQRQPQCVTDVTTDLYDCGTWGVSASWNVPADAVSGVYIALLERADNHGASHIIFVVRNDGNHSDVLFQTSDPTWNAYNTYGGASFYQGGSIGRALKLSYNRPFATRNWQNGRDFYFSSEFAQVRFLERNGYDVSYLAGVDTDRRGSELLNHKVFLSVGHDEYWSAAQRHNIEAARNAGVNLQFLSGNEAYWHTRYEPSIDGMNTSYRTLVTYKETWANAKIDPSPEWTGTWRDPRFADASTGGHLPENALTGTMYVVNNSDSPVTVNSDEGKLRLWRNTGLSSLASGTSAQLAPHTVGYESDEDVDNGFRPAGLIRLSTTVAATSEYLVDYGNTVVPGTTQHHVTMYRAPSGALVFSAGSVQWAWGLDSTHDGQGAAPDTRMQQAQINLLADMGAQPTTLMSGLTAATKSTDTTAPTTTITTPTAGQSIANGASVTVTGTASDVGGRVAGVEVSTDGGATWHAAQGRESWTYTYSQQGLGQATIIARAIDDSANYSAAGVTRTVTATGPASVFGNVTPPIPSSTDVSAVELGLRFTPDSSGFVTGVRFYKGSANTGAHVGSLWDAAGNRIASVSFTNETATGWQTARFFTAVPVTAGATYTVSYSAPNGGYAYTEIYWPYLAKASTPVTVPSGVGANAPGVFGTVGQRPTSTFHDANYYVDPLFERTDSSPIRVQPADPIAGSSSASLTGPVTATFSRPVVASTVQFTVKNASGAAVAGTTTYDATSRNGSFTPTAAFQPSTVYTVTPSATDSNGVGVETGSSWSFTTQAVDLPEGQCPCSLYPESARPMLASGGDSSSVTIGVRFSVDLSGTISALKFFKGQGNAGQHVASLWKADGTKLATATFAAESTFGWQTVQLSTPIAVSAGQTYVVSYVATQGGYAVDFNKYASAVKRGPINVPANGGAFTYQGGFPSSTSSSSYLVDVVYTPAAQPPVVTSTAPAAGAFEVPANAPVSVTFSGAIATGFVGQVTANGAAVAGTWSLSADGKTATFAHSADLPVGSQVVAKLTKVVGANGAAVPDVSWSFAVVQDPNETVVSLFAGQTPQVVDGGDSSSVELGFSFTTTVAGEVRGVRFYKGQLNTGQHTGTLWGPSGQVLAQVVFQGESASGWQRATFSTPVHITPGTSYTISYLAPNGGYSYTSGAFAQAVTSGPLTAAASTNGVYRYGTGGAMPTNTWGSTSYAVDVEFVADPPITSVTPAQGATGVAVSTTVTATFGRDVASKSPTISLAGPAGAVAGASVYNATTRTVTFTPSAPLANLITYTASVKLGASTISTWTFRTTQASGQTAPVTFFGNAVPPAPTGADGTPIEVGTAFQVSQNASVTAIRFYKESVNTGTHRGTVWSSDGQALAQVTFTGESGSGWQKAELSTPLAIVPGQTYVVSVFMPNGGYSIQGGYFNNPVTAGIVTMPSGANGRYLYTSTGGLPVSSWNSTAYFVDAEIVTTQ
ncbi:DUF4082 domain-containing protein [Microbacterium sp. B2969]|uniref:DUF4082 domain-containing protein n=1 Tax=Microbacterium alkaliflavum TaxID=3248839 RepID=A0ABW7Q9N9_9MICO